MRLAGFALAAIALITVQLAAKLSAQQGNATGGAHQAMLDAERKPITAGGAVNPGPLIYRNDAERAGLTAWRHIMGSPEKNLILETVGSGVALIDYDNDGWLDIYLVNGSTFDALAGKAAAPHAALFHNNHDGTFTDVAVRAGVTNDRWGFGVAVGDYDNDGWPDLYVTNYGKNRLYRNNRDGTFTDVAEKAGVTVGGWSTGPTFGDYDGDGRLDLFVPGYVHFELEHPPVAGSAAVSFPTCNFRGMNVMCGPRGLKGEPDHLFHNNGDGTFTDVSQKLGVSDPHRYFGLTAVFADVNNDGKLDLLVADDSTPNYLYVNKGKGNAFEDASYTSGYALNEDGRETASMGIALGDTRNVGLLDIYNTVFSDDANPLYRNEGDASFSDVSYRMGIAEITIPFLGWGAGFIDYDNDGWKDLFVVNGHVYPAVDRTDWGTTFAQRPLLFHNTNGKLAIVPATKGTALAETYTGRGAAFGDLLNDGRIDVVINQMDRSPALLLDVAENRGHWLGLKLVGGPHSPRDAVGAIVYLTAGAVRQRGDVLSGGSFASSNDQRVFFGLGTATHADKIEIHWPSGAIELAAANRYSVDRYYVVQEGSAASPKAAK